MGPAIISTGLVGLQLFTTSIIVGFTHSTSLFRLVALFTSLVSATSQLILIYKVQHPVARAFLGSASIFLVVLYIDTALLSRWTFEAGCPTSSLGGQALNKHTRTIYDTCDGGIKLVPRKAPSSSDRLCFGFSVSAQSRFPGTSWAVKNIPRFRRADPSFVPSKAEFLTRNFLKCCVHIFIIRLSTQLGNPSDNPIVFSSDRIAFFRRLNDISVDELISRFLGTLGYWTIQYLIIDLLYSLLAIAAISLNITEVDTWPPVFGHVDEAWSLRQFWGSFYHQLIRRGCSSIAHFVTYPCLNLKKGSLLARYTFITNVFIVSGIFHALSDGTQGIPSSESGAMSFFCMQAAGIMFEDTLQALFKRVAKIEGYKISKSQRMQMRTFGYVWVMAWLTWTSPIWIYPAIQRDKGTPIIPF